MEAEKRLEPGELHDLKTAKLAANSLPQEIPSFDGPIASKMAEFHHNLSSKLTS